MGQLGGALPEPDKSTEDQEVRENPRKRYTFWVFLSVLVIGILWLNGPGFRMIAPWMARHYLEKLGIQGDFKVEGRLTGGVVVSELVIAGDAALGKLSIGRIVPDYRWRNLRSGRLDGLLIEDLHVETRFGLESEKNPEPFDLKKFVERLRVIRGRVVPMELELKNVTWAARNPDGETVMRLGSSNLLHKSGDDLFKLGLGTITDANGRTWPAQDGVIDWKPESLSVERLDPMGGISLRNFDFQMPMGEEPSVEAQVHVDDAVFSATVGGPGLSSLKVDLLEGKVLSRELAGRFGREMPVEAALTSFSLEVDQLLPDPGLAVGSARILLEDVRWQNWSATEVGIDATLEQGQVLVQGRAAALDGELLLEASAPIERTGRQLDLGDVVGNFRLSDFSRMVRRLGSDIPAMDPEAFIPQATLSGTFSAPRGADGFGEILAEMNLVPEDQELAPAVGLKVRWARNAPISADLSLDGLTVKASYELERKSYQASVFSKGMATSRLDLWLRVFKIQPPGVVSFTGQWTGHGSLTDQTHNGEVFVEDASWSRDESEPITATGTVRYEWPGKIEANPLKVRMGDQTVNLEVALAEQKLIVHDFLWTQGEQELAAGSASFPVPEDFIKWREGIAEEKRPILITLSSRELSLGLLKQWVPALEPIDEQSTGKLDIKLSGTYANPVLLAKLEAHGLRSPTQPKLPPADLVVTLTGSGGRLDVEGVATAPDFPAAEMKASMAFRPAVWAENTQELMAEEVDARINLPRLDLSRFATLLPPVEKLTGTVVGNIAASGSLGKPDLRGSLEVAGGGVVLKDKRIPPIQGINLSMDLTQDRISLKQLAADISGGSLRGEGTWSMKKDEPRVFDLRLRASHVPVMRNELILLRVNADLRLRGPWEAASISGGIETVDSIFYRDIELLPLGTPFTTPSAADLPKLDAPSNPTASFPEPFRNWSLDLTVSANDPLLIRGNFAKGDIRGRMKVRGTIGKPAPDGTFTVRDFRASLPFSTLSVRSGTATFTPDTGFDPILEIRGTAEPRPYRVTLYVYGRASDPKLVLTSNPPLPENEIMTLLATGTTTSGLEDPQAASSRALQLLVEELRRGRFRFGRRLRPVLALLDRVDFSLAEADPYTTESYSTATLSITDRWFLSAGVGETGDTRLLAIWRLSFR
jgi:hypothetical protein